MANRIKKVFKPTSIIALLLAVVLGTTFTAHAASVQFHSVTLSTSWKTIAECSTGINRNITVSSLVTGTDGLGALSPDIRMLGKNGNVVWSESKSCPGLGTRVYSCGANVYKVQIRVAYGGGTARAY